MKFRPILLWIFFQTLTQNLSAASKVFDEESQDESVCMVACNSTQSVQSSNSYRTPPPSPRVGGLPPLPISPESRRRDRELQLHHFTQEELEAHRAEYEDGRLVNRANRELRYQVIYFLHADGNLYLMPNLYAEENGYQHSSFDRDPADVSGQGSQGGHDCIMAGEMYISSGKILVNDDSGHYKPSIALQETLERLQAVVRKLEDLGIRNKPIEITRDAW